MTKEEQIKESIDEFKEVIGIKLKHCRDLETNPEGNYHLLWNGWKKYISEYVPEISYSGDDPEYAKAVKNLSEAIQEATTFSRIKLEKIIQELLKDSTDPKPSFFFLVSLISNLTVLYSVMEIQNKLFENYTSLEEKRNLVKRIIKNGFGNEVMYDLIFPAFDYYFKRTCPGKVGEISKEDYDRALILVGSEICSAEGMKTMFRPLLREQP